MEFSPKVLIVDDQLSVRETLKAFLLQENYQFSFAADGMEALTLVDEIRPDVLLLDVMMPGMDGFEVCRKLKANKLWSHIPVILVTALDSKDDMARGFEVGADDFLSKPVNSLELRARVRSMLRIKKQFDELAAMLQLREDMAAMIVHDMRNPLTPILGISELLLLADNLTPQQLKDIDTIRFHTRRLNSFLNDMLMLTKIEQDKLILNRANIDLSRFVLTIEESHQVVAQSKDITLAVELPSETKRVFLDATLFQRVLDNLVSNALKFSPPHSTITLKVEYPTQTPTDQGPHLRLQVLDEGPGIPQTHQKNIFDKFKIVDLKKKQIPQVGLGLAFCKLVVEAHGGHISVKDNIPKGSIFTVEI